jgi:trk system potassium uptake protein TrkA
VGAGSLAVATARLLIKRGAEVVFIERDKEAIDELSDQLDCGFVHGDGSRPAMLREAGPAETDMLFCLSSDDQTNILASLVGRSLGYDRVVTKIEDWELEHICIELGLEDTIVPDRTIARYLADTAQGKNILELSAMMKNGARMLSFVIHEGQEGTVEGMDLPQRSRIICLYRDERLILPDPDTALRKNDEVVILTHQDEAQALIDRWQDGSGDGDRG